MTGVTPTSAQTVKDRLLNLKADERLLVDPTGERSPEVIKVAQEPEVSNSVEATLAQRGSRYGDFTDHAAICQELKEVMTGCTKVNPERPAERMHGWNLLSSVQRQALEVIADKIARILSGDPNYDDNWHDIQGYAKLVEDRLPKKGE